MSPEINPQARRQRRIEEVLSRDDVRQATVNGFFLIDDEVTLTRDKRSVEVTDAFGNTLNITQYFLEGGDILDVQHKENIGELETTTVYLYCMDEEAGIWSPMNSPNTMVSNQ